MLAASTRRVAMVAVAEVLRWFGCGWSAAVVVVCVVLRVWCVSGKCVVGVCGWRVCSVCVSQYVPRVFYFPFSHALEARAHTP
jgi:hypothetical protein